MDDIGLGKYVIDKEMKTLGHERIGYTVAYDEELECYGILFKDEPSAVYWMDGDQLQVLEYKG